MVMALGDWLRKSTILTGNDESPNSTFYLASWMNPIFILVAKLELFLILWENKLMNIKALSNDKVEAAWKIPQPNIGKENPSAKRIKIME